MTHKVLYGNKKESGLFGYSLNSEGDLNFDGIADLVVGAPYENDGEGAVYIFNGGSEFFETYSQVGGFCYFHFQKMFFACGYKLTDKD